MKSSLLRILIVFSLFALCFGAWGTYETQVHPPDRWEILAMEGNVYLDLFARTGRPYRSEAEILYARRFAFSWFGIGVFTLFVWIWLKFSSALPKRDS